MRQSARRHGDDVGLEHSLSYYSPQIGQSYDGFCGGVLLECRFSNTLVESLYGDFLCHHGEVRECENGWSHVGFSYTDASHRNELGTSFVELAVLECEIPVTSSIMFDMLENGFLKPRKMIVPDSCC